MQVRFLTLPLKAHNLKSFFQIGVVFRKKPIEPGYYLTVNPAFYEVKTKSTMKLFKKKIIYREDNKPYLIRYSLFTCKWFSVKLHNILISDYDCQHDHPWAFITFLIKGGYVEYTPASSRVYSKFSLLYRPAEYAHRLEIHQPVWSFVVTFKKVREWGFFTSEGWVKWFRYSSSNACK